ARAPLPHALLVEQANDPRAELVGLVRRERIASVAEVDALQPDERFAVAHDRAATVEPIASGAGGDARLAATRQRFGVLLLERMRRRDQDPVAGVRRLVCVLVEDARRREAIARVVPSDRRAREEVTHLLGTANAL